MLLCLWLDISVKAITSVWPVLPTCPSRASWSEERGWSLWEFCLRPTLCCIATCTSWRTKSGKACWEGMFFYVLLFLHWHSLFISSQFFLFLYVPTSDPCFFCVWCSHQLNMSPVSQLVAVFVTRTHWGAVFLRRLNTKLEKLWQQLLYAFLQHCSSYSVLFKTTWLSLIVYKYKISHTFRITKTGESA